MWPSNFVGWNVHLNWEKPAHHPQDVRGEGADGQGYLWEPWFSGGEPRPLGSGLPGRYQKDGWDGSNKLNFLVARNHYCFEQILLADKRLKFACTSITEWGYSCNFCVECSSAVVFNNVNRFKWLLKWLQSDTRKNSCPWEGDIWETPEAQGFSH